MLRTLARRAAEPARPAFDIHSNPYKAKRLWPPDFSKLSPKHQFRLERKFRRRSQLKWARPRWKKFVNLTQWATISCEDKHWGFITARLLMRSSRGYLRCTLHGLE